MARVVQLTGARRVELGETPPLDPVDLIAGQVRVRTLYSGISAGTELTGYRGSNPYLNKRWDPASRLFVPDGRTFSYPLISWGYEEVGEIVEVGPGVARLAAGDVVWGSWGHRSDAVLPAEQLVGHQLPASVDPLLGIFARVGAVGLNAVLAADLHVGEHVAVFGQGVIGLLATRLAALSGTTVVAVERLESRLALSRQFGAAHLVDPVELDPAMSLRGLTEGRGADTCIELSGSYRALHEAIRTVAAGGRVVAAGFYQEDGVGLRLGEEFHHNRIEVVASQISAVASRLSGRWTVERLHRTFMDLVGAGRIDPAPLVSHVLDAEDAAQAYALLDERPEQALQVVLRFAEPSRGSRRPAGDEPPLIEEGAAWAS